MLHISSAIQLGLLYGQDSLHATVRVHNFGIQLPGLCTLLPFTVLPTYPCHVQTLLMIRPSQYCSDWGHKRGGTKTKVEVKVSGDISQSASTIALAE